MQLGDPRVAVEYLILSVSRGNPRRFAVMLSQYQIEGATYDASLFTVSPGHVSELRSSETGFRCRAMFPAESLAKQDRAKATKVKPGVFQVKLTVEIAHVSLIAVQEATDSSAMAVLYSI